MLSCFCLPGPLRRVCYDTYANDAYDDDRGYGLGSGRTGGSDSVHRDAVWIRKRNATMADSAQKIKHPETTYWAIPGGVEKSGGDRHALRVVTFLTAHFRAHGNLLASRDHALTGATVPFELYVTGMNTSPRQRMGQFVQIGFFKAAPIA